MQGKTRGLFWAPLVPSTVVAVWALVLGDTETALSMFLMAAAFGYAAEFLVGLPLLTWLERRGHGGLLSILGAGAVSPIPFLAVAVLVFLPWHGLTRIKGFRNLLVFAMPLGLLAGFTYWLVTYLHARSNRDGS